MKMWSSWLSVLTVLQAVLTVLLACETSSFKVDNTCPTDCSQKTQRVSGDYTRFNCSIGGIDRITKYRETYPVFFKSDAKSIFDAPTLQDIWFYKKNYSDNSLPNPALAVKFMLPKGVADPAKNSTYLLPQAVLLEFKGVEEKTFSDAFYSNCPRQRIFQFHNYTPNTTYDVYNPRSLVFDCLVGLEEPSEERFSFKVYNITLTTVQGKSATYMVTVNGIDAHLQEVRQLVLATEVLDEGPTPGQAAIRLVIQTLPQIDSYIVSLLKQGQPQPVDNTSLPKGSNSVVFHNVQPGTYNINVLVRSHLCQDDSLPCMNTTSYRIHIAPRPHDSVHYADHRENSLKLVAMVMGCIVGSCLLLLLLVCHIRRRRKKGKTTVHGCVLQPYKPGTDEYEVVDRLIEYLEEACNCCLEKCLPEDWNQSTQDTKLRDRCETILGKRAKFALIVSAKDAFKPDSSCTFENFYSYSVTKAVDKKKNQNSLWIFAVDFSFSKAPIPSILKDNATHFHLLQNLGRLREKITELNNLPSSSESLMGPDMSALQRAINKLEQTVPKRVSCNTERPPLPEPPKLNTVPPIKEDPSLKNSIPDEMKELMKAFNKSDEDLRDLSFYMTADEAHCLLPKDEETRTKPETNAYVVADSGYFLSTSTKLKQKVSHHSDIHTAGGNATDFDITISKRFQKEPISSETLIKPDTSTINDGYVTTTSPLLSRKEPTTQIITADINKISGPSFADTSNGYVSTTSPPMTRKGPFQSADHPSKKHATPADHSQVKSLGPHKNPSQETAGYVREEDIENLHAQNMHDVSDMVVRPKTPRGMVRQHSSGSGYVGHDFVEKYPDQPYTCHPSTTAHQPCYQCHRKPCIPVRRGMGHCTDYIPHEAMKQIPDHHDFRRADKHRDAHFDTRMSEVNNSGQNSGGYVPYPMAYSASHVPYNDSHVPHTDNHVPYNDSHVPYNDSHVPYNDSHVQFDSYHAPCDNSPMPYVDHRMFLDQGTHPSRKDSEAIEMNERFTRYPPCRNIARQDSNPNSGGHNPYVGHTDFDERNPNNQGFYVDCTQYTDNPDVRFYLRNPSEEVDHYDNMPPHPPICQRQTSTSLLSSDHSLEYETSFDSDPTSYNHMIMGPMDTNSSGYVGHNMERQRPIGSSDNSIAAAQISFTAVDPLSLEKTIKQGSKESDKVTDSKRRSQTPPASGFTEAVALEPRLREEYEKFEPIPPDDDGTSCGSMSDLMQEMGQINNS